jgi:hypothetical protein
MAAISSNEECADALGPIELMGREEDKVYS